MSDIENRKGSHLELCANEDVEHHGSTLLDDVQLLHNSLPERSLAEIDLSVEMLGRRLLAPIVISGMSGGTPEAGALNRGLAEVAQKLGLGMGVGSQRAMLEDPGRTGTYSVREVAPDILLLANLGVVQARDAGVDRVASVVRDIGADAICIHLNPAQELVQDEGDRDFRGCLDAIAELVETLPVPIVVKETGCGLAPHTLERLCAVGVRWVDVSGAGGTSWTGVEALRGSPRQHALGNALREWGIPTAASLVYARRAGLSSIASGGIRTPLDVVRALALGAEAAGLALPLLRAFANGGVEAALTEGERLVEGILAATLLAGATDVAGLRNAPKVLGPRLRAWLDEPA